MNFPLQPQIRHLTLLVIAVAEIDHGEALSPLNHGRTIVS